MNLLETFIKRLYGKIQSRYTSIYKRRTGFVLNQICLKKNNRTNNVLILGAREEFAWKIIDKTENRFSYYLVDKQPTQLLVKNFHYTYSDLNINIPYEDNFFDCIIADQLIEHLVNPDNFLHEISRVGKQGCCVIIGSENLAAWHNIIAMIFGLHPFSDHYSEKRRVGNPLSIHHKKELLDPLMRHCKVPTIKALSELMILNHMDIIDIEGFGHMFPFGTFWDRLHSIQFVITANLHKPKPPAR